MRRCPRSSERGFTLVEVLVATGLWIVLGGTLLFVTQGLLGAARAGAAQQRAYVALTQLIETLDAESSSALAIFVPPRDVLGTNNADGHELDFYSRDALRNGRFWAYRFDRQASTLQRYTYSAPGSVATPSDPPLRGIASFATTRKSASSLSSPFANGYVTRDVAVNFNYPSVNGGNAIVAVNFGDHRDTFTLELLPGTMTSGFAVIVSTFTPTPAPTATSAPSAPAPAPSPTVPGAEYLYATTYQNPDTETTYWADVMEYLNPPGIWYNAGASVPVIGVLVGQTVYINTSCDSGISGNQFVYASELRDVNVTDPSGSYYFQCAFTPTIAGWLSFGYWNSIGSPVQSLETILVGGYSGPFNNDVFPPPAQPGSPGGS
ncbi:MAG TPA: prepilin-type N-terminal cleavage/methylation domain-containing protein [Candidatus Baltobacteraceae bacterium]|jgi:type II secretory pathway pseudopilin PulG